MTTPIDRQTQGPGGNILSHIMTEGTPRLDSDGETIWLDVIRRMEEVYSELIRNESDLEAKNAELEEAQSFISSVIEAVSDVLVVLDSAGTIKTGNRAFAHLVGNPSNRMVGRAFADCVLHSDLDALQDMIAQGGKNTPSETEICVISADGGNECLAMRAAALFDGRQKRIGTVLTGRPITELRRAYKALAEAHEELKQAQGRLIEQEKMASLGRLVAGVAHELNNPVSFVYGNIYTLDRYRKNLATYLEAIHSGQPEEAERLRKTLKIDAILADFSPLLEGSIEGANRITDIVKNLRRLSFSRTADREDVDADRLLRVAAQLAARSKNSRAAIEIDSPGPLHIRAHEGQIHQVFVNLIDNALDAVAGRAEGTVTLTLAQDNARVVVSVADNGPGIAPQHLDKIFEPFFTTKSVGEGTGLGLWISFSIVRDYGGTIEASNSKDGGAVFSISFPV